MRSFPEAGAGQGARGADILASMHSVRWFAVVLLCVLVGCDAASDDGDASVARDAAPPPRPDAGPDAGPPADLDGFIEWEMRAGGIPGAAVSIIEDGTIALARTYGYADIESSRPVDEHTLFIMASISKTMAVTRAMELVEQGLLDLDAPIDAHLGYTVRHPSYPDLPITMRMLLTHTSGLEDDYLLLAHLTTSGDPTVTLADFAEGYVTPGGAYYADAHWASQPGTRRSYCNACFGVVGAVIEGAGSEDYRAQTSSGIFQIVDMDGAGWFLSDVDVSRLATPYGWNSRRGFYPLAQNGFAYYPAASLRVSITGLSRFLIAIGNGGEIDGARMVSQESVDEMLRHQIPGIDGGQALTFHDRYVNGHLYVGHSGETFGGSTQMLLSREGTHGIILLTNSDAYVRSTIGLPEGDDAMEAILSRLDEEALAL